MITEDYVSFEIAQLLKKKEFNEEGRTFYNSNGKFEYCAFPLNHNLDISSGFVSAPTHQMALKWLREVHKINIVIGVASDDDNIYSLWKFDIWNGNYSIIWGDKREKFNYYEQAVEAALKYTLENLI